MTAGLLKNRWEDPFSIPVLIFICKGAFKSKAQGGLYQKPERILRGGENRKLMQSENLEAIWLIDN